MHIADVIIRTKLTPPRRPAKSVIRGRLTARLREALDYRLTLVHGNAGYGKSTALAALKDEVPVLVWYHLDEEDTAALPFLSYLVYSFYSVLPGLGDGPLAALETWEDHAPDLPWGPVLDALINELTTLKPDPPILFVLDDAHLAEDIPAGVEMLDRLVKHAPANLHIVLATRSPLELSGLVSMRVRNEVLEISEEELAFTSGEIAQLFEEQFDLPLNEEQITLLAEQTEGWAIAIQLVWQGIHEQHELNALPETLGRFSGLKDDLFAYLAQEVLARQPNTVQAFLLDTSVLRALDAALCDCLRRADNSAYIIQGLIREGLFVVELGDGRIRYHHLFREFLLARVDAGQRRELHQRAAECHRLRGEDEESINHWLSAGQPRQAATILTRIGRAMIQAGRLEQLETWLAELPGDIMAEEPALLIYHGDMSRLRSRFPEALAWYRQAEERGRIRGHMMEAARALQGQARIYLDTVNPARAEAPLREALRLLDGQDDRESQADLLDMLAENQLNRGQSAEAETLQAQANALRDGGHGIDDLDVRVLLRTGRLDEAVTILEARAAAELDAPVLRPRSHRETHLLLSLIQSYQGLAEQAYENAKRGIERGKALDSLFVTAVGCMRQGHAALLMEGEHFEEALKCFERAIGISDSLSVVRLKVEAHWGLCRAYGYRGLLSEAEEIAEEGLRIIEQVGDDWIDYHMRAALGASYVLADQGEAAVRWLTEADHGFRKVSDSYGRAGVLLWLCLLWYSSGDEAHLRRGLDELFSLAEDHGYDYLFLRRTLMGPPDPRRVVPLLLWARSEDIHAGYADRLLHALDLGKLERHPGYQLRIQTLGALRVWRGDKEMESSEWQREKARQLFLLFVTWRRQMMDREKVWAMLWPEQMADSANQSFKVALNALYNALEPDRGRGEPSSFVVRKGSLYALRPEADITLDVDQFLAYVSEGDARYRDDPAAAFDLYQQALALYQGDYLDEFPYEDWWSRERTRLRELFLRTADRVTVQLAGQDRWQEVIEVANHMMVVDNCWETAYRMQMTAYAMTGNRPQALRVYQRAIDTLREELDAPPSAKTVQLYEDILGDGDIPVGNPPDFV